MNNIIDFYYFSGTGNTLLIINHMKKIFTDNNYDVNLYKIEKSYAGKININNIIGIGFPVACQSTFPFIWDFFRKLPNTKGTKIFIVNTLHSFSGAIVGPLKRLVLKKGFKTIGAKEIIMPNNFFRQHITKIKDNKIIANGLKSAEKYALSIINNKSKWRRYFCISDVFYWIVSRKLIWKKISKYGKKFKLEKEKCNKCKVCSKICPVNNIKMKNYPEFDMKCQLCLRCIMFCPKKAIKMPLIKYARYKSVKLKDIMN